MALRQKDKKEQDLNPHCHYIDLYSLDFNNNYFNLPEKQKEYILNYKSHRLNGSQKPLRSSSNRSKDASNDSSLIIRSKENEKSHLSLEAKKILTSNFKIPFKSSKQATGRSKGSHKHNLSLDSDYITQAKKTSKRGKRLKKLLRDGRTRFNHHKLINFNNNIQRFSMNRTKRKLRRILDSRRGGKGDAGLADSRRSAEKLYSSTAEKAKKFTKTPLVLKKCTIYGPQQEKLKRFGKYYVTAANARRIERVLKKSKLNLKVKK